MARAAEAKRAKPKQIARRGLMLVLSSPSGAGKTTLSRMLLKADRNVELSVSVTTRPKRRGEVNGRDYHFIDRARFDAMVKAGELLEWAEVFGHRYGTPRRAGREGAARRAATCCSISTGRAPSSCAKRRATIWSASSSCRRPSTNWSAGCTAPRAGQPRRHRARMAKAAGEMSHWPEYDYVIVNRDNATRRSPKCGRSSPPSGSSASARSDCPTSCAGCRRSL